ncbi:MAG: hypothetical protein JKY48_03675 [Flavobacteriales bacterium]|nr:hypothetical protein [Flavobacteriales bacterium]
MGDTLALRNYMNDELDGIWLYYCEHGFVESKVQWEKEVCKKIIHFYYNETVSVILEFSSGISEIEHRSF